MTEPPFQPTPGVPAPDPVGDVDVAGAGTTPLDTKALWSLILGVIATVLAIVPVVDLLSVVLGVIAIVLGVMARKGMSEAATRGRGLATAGIVLGIVAIVVTVVVLVLLELVLRNVGGAMVG